MCSTRSEPRRSCPVRKNTRSLGPAAIGAERLAPFFEEQGYIEYNEAVYGVQVEGYDMMYTSYQVDKAKGQAL